MPPETDPATTDPATDPASVVTLLPPTTDPVIPTAKPATPAVDPMADFRTAMEAEITKARAEAQAAAEAEIAKRDAELAKYREVESETKKREKVESAARKKAEEEAMDVRQLIERKEAEWNEREQALRADIERERATAEQERKLAALQQYAVEQMSQHQDDIMPELHYTIAGNSVEEIDASIRAAVAATASIGEQFETQQQQQISGMRGVSISGAPPSADPTTDFTDISQLSGDDIRNMPMDQYAKLRKSGRFPGMSKVTG